MTLDQESDTPFLPRRSRLELAALAHVGAMLLFSGWAYGGNIWWARASLAAWGLGGGALITALALAQGGGAGREARARARTLAPWALFCLLALASCLNPSFRAVSIGGEPRLLHDEDAVVRWLPSTAGPAGTLRELAFFSGAWLAACNLWLVVRSRRALRRLLAVAAASAFALAVFGTVQALLVPSRVLLEGPRTGWFTGYYLGAELSPQRRFFSTFIYNNHWGAFLALWLAVTAGLLFHFARRVRRQGRSLWHTPFAVLLAGALLMGAGAPMSASRAATALAGALGMAALGATLARLAASRRRDGRSAWPAATGALAVAVAFLAAAAWLAERAIIERTRDTREGLAADRTLFRERLALYRDTVALAAQKPVFGWGLGSYPQALQLMRPRPSAPNRQYELSYANAHSDWLQSLAETGFAGTALLALMAALPLVWLPRGAWRRPLTGWPLLGCALVALYAWVEFPFGNGAVTVSFWAIFFAALRHAELSARAAAPEAAGTGPDQTND